MNNAKDKSHFDRVLYMAVSLLILFVLVGCAPKNENTESESRASENVQTDSSGVNSNETRIQIIVSDDETLQPIKRAEIQLTLPQELHPLKYTDNTGRAIYEVNRNMVNEIAQIDIKFDGYEPQMHQIMLSNTPILSVYLVPIGATPVPRETPSVTPIPPTPRPSDTATPIPTATSTSTNTPTATHTNTPPPEPPTDDVTLMRKEGAETVFVMAGADERNVQLGTLGIDETAVVIGRTTQNEWLQIITERNIEGWVANCEVTLSTQNLDNIPITWSGSVTAKICEGPGTIVPPPGSCVEVTLTRTEWPSKEFDNILLSWSYVPSSASQLKLWVTGPTNDGGTDYVVDPTISDTNIGYEVELFKFEDGNFKPGESYTYVVQALNDSGGIICATQGTFIP